MLGICTSTTRHEVSFSCPALRKFSAESNAAARKPNDSISRVVVLRTDSSSSMTEIKFLATLDLQWTQAIYKCTRNLLGIGGFCVPERTTRVMLSFTSVWGRAFVLRVWGGAFVLLERFVTGSMQISVYSLHGSTEDSSLSIIFTSSATDCACIFSIARLR